MNRRTLALAGGLVAFALSLLAIFDSGLARLGLDRLLVTVIGLFAILLGLRAIQIRRRKGLEAVETPDPELPMAVQPPGEDLESVVSQFLGSQRLRASRTRLQEGLEAAAVSVLWRYGGYSPETARQAVADGSWTSDVRAASYLGSVDAPSLPLRAQVADLFRGRSTGRERIRHAVDEIASVAGLEPLGDPAPGDSDRAAPATTGDARAHFLEDEDPGNEWGDEERGDEWGDEDPGNGGDPTEGAVAAPEAGSTGVRDQAPVESDGGASSVLSRRTHTTGHWRGVTVVALLGIGVGILVKQPAALLAGVIGIGFAAYARSRAFPPGAVSISRSVDTPRPAPGEPVSVSVTIRNESEQFLPDCRLIDGVPDALSVTDGSPRLGTALRPGERASTTYTVTGRRGVHSFGPATVIARDLTGSVEQTSKLETHTEITCIPTYRALSEPVPLREQATQYVGQLETRSGGEGVEFFSTRNYRPGDAKRHIDWKRHARTGELTTVMFREERTATVVLVVDARDYAYVGPIEDGPTAVDRSVEAAGRLYETLTSRGNQVGLAALDTESCWIAPGSGTEHGLRVDRELGTNPALAPVPSEGRSWVKTHVSRLRKRLDPGTQLVFITPLCDANASRFARELDEIGYPVTVLSPNASADRTPGHQLARVARSLRISALRSAGIPVVDWPWADTLDAVLARTNERRSA